MDYKRLDLSTVKTFGSTGVLRTAPIRKPENDAMTTFPPLQPNTARVAQAAHRLQEDEYITPPKHKRKSTGRSSRHTNAITTMPFIGMPTGAGFDRLHYSLHTVVKRLPGCLENKWDAIADYLDGYFNDQDSTRVSDLMQQMYDRVGADTKRLAEPSEPKTALACVFLDQITHFFSKFLPCMKGICDITRKELLKAIYLQVPEGGGRPIDSVTLDNSAIPTKVNVDNMVDVLSSWYLNPTWAKQAKEQAAQLSSIQFDENTTSDVISSLRQDVRYWKDAYLRKVMTGWKSYVKFQRKNKEFTFQTQKQFEDMQARITELEEERKKLLDYSTHIVQLQSKITGLKNSNSHLQAQLADMGEKEAQLLEQLNHQTLLQNHMQAKAVLESDKTGHIDQLKQQLDKANGRYSALCKILHDLQNNLLANNYFRDLVHNKKEFQVLESMKNPSNMDAIVTAFTLIEWANNLLKQHVYGKHRLLTELGNGSPCIDSYLCLVNILDSNIMPEDTLGRYIARSDGSPLSSDIPMKADDLLQGLETMKIPPHCTQHDLVKPSPEGPHMMLLAELFLHYADASMSPNYDKVVNQLKGTMLLETTALHSGDNVSEGGAGQAQPQVSLRVSSSTTNKEQASDALVSATPTSSKPGSSHHNQSPKAAYLLQNYENGCPSSSGVSTKVDTTTPYEWQVQLTTTINNSNHWKRLGHNVYQQCVALLLDRLKGNRRLLLSDAKDGKLPLNKIRDLLSPDDYQSEFELLQLVVDSHVMVLKNVYKFYSQSDSNALNILMSDHEYMRFCSDARIPDKELDRHQLRAIFYTVNGTPTEDNQFSSHIDTTNKPISSTLLTQTDDTQMKQGADMKKRRRSSTSGPIPQSPSTNLQQQPLAGGIQDEATTMTFLEWIEAIVRIAKIKYGKKHTTLADQTHDLIIGNIVKYCNHVEVDEFKEMVYKPNVQTILKYYKKYLYDIFKHYSQRDNKFCKVLELNFHNFKKFMDEANLVDEIFTHYAVQHIFTKVQDDDDLSLTMTFTEFQIGIVATAMFKNPAPYLPIHQRVQSFFDVHLLPRMQVRFHWKAPLPSSVPKGA